MRPSQKIETTPLERRAYVYVRQSSAAPVQHPRESTDRQYQSVERVLQRGWSPQYVKVIDVDRTQSGSGSTERSGFTRMTAEHTLRQAGRILSLEVFPVVGNHVDWYRLLDRCALTDSLTGDEDGLCPLGLFHDRLPLGLKATISIARWTHPEGVLHLTPALSDGTRSLLPVRTDVGFHTAAPWAPLTVSSSLPRLGSLSDLSRTRRIVDVWLRRLERSEPAAPSLSEEESHGATTTTEVLADAAGGPQSATALGHAEGRRAGENHRRAGPAHRGHSRSGRGPRD